MNLSICISNVRSWRANVNEEMRSENHAQDISAVLGSRGATCKQTMTQRKIHVKYLSVWLLV